MAYQKIYPNSVNTDLSSSKTRMNFTKLINDYNKGLINTTLNSVLDGITIDVFNVKMGNTVECNVDVFNKSIPVSYTSKNEDTTDRTIHVDKGVPLAGYDVINKIINNNNNLDVTITSGTSNFKAPILVDFTLHTKNIKGVNINNVLVSGNEADKPIRVSRTDGVNGIYVSLESKDPTNNEPSKDVIKLASNGNYVDIPAGTIKDLSLSYTVFVRSGGIYESAGAVGFTWGNDASSVSVLLSNITIAQPTITNLSTVGDLWEKPIDVSWRSDNQEGYEYEYYYNNVKIGNGVGGTQKGFVIPANTFKGKLPASVKVRTFRTYAGNKVYSQWAEKNLSLKDIEATISDLLVQGDMWEQPIILSWLSTNQQQFKIEVLKSNTVVKTYTGTTAKTYTIAANQLSSGAHTFKVWVGYENRFVNSQSRVATLKDIEATISNLIVTGDLWERPIGLTWLSVNQQKFRVEVSKNNVIVKTYNGTTAKAFTIPADDLSAGSHDIKVIVAHKDRYVNSQQRTVTLKDVIAKVSLLTISGSNIDLPLTLGWTSENQETYELEILKAESVVKKYTGTTPTTRIVPPSTLTTGLHKFRVRVAFRGRFSNWVSIEQSLTETLPSIGILEPDGRREKKDQPIRIYWTSVNQTRWTLNVNGNEYSGTNQTEQILPAGTLQTGRATSKLTIYLEIAGKTKPATKTVEFIVVGDPPSPTITSAATFNNNRPIFTWDSSDQSAYMLQLIDMSNGELTYSSGWVNGLIVTHRIKDYIANGEYIVMVKVKNIYLFESPWSEMRITINATTEPDIDIKVYNEYDNAVISWDNKEGSYSVFYVFRNGEIIHRTSSNQYVDLTPQGKCIYFVRGITPTDIYTDSEEVLCEIDLIFPILDCSGMKKELVYRVNDADLSISYNPMSSKVFFSGRKRPSTFTSDNEDISYSFSSVDLSKDGWLDILDMAKSKEPVLYRSNRYKLWLTFEPIDMDDRYTSAIYTIGAYETDYSEEVDYD